jgi:hypothetical protein
MPQNKNETKDKTDKQTNRQREREFETKTKTTEVINKSPKFCCTYYLLEIFGFKFGIGIGVFRNFGFKMKRKLCNEYFDILSLI